MPIFEDDSDAREAHQEKLARRIKTSVGVGNELVDLTDCGLDDENVKLLVRQLSEAETEVRRRLKEVHDTGLAAAKARDEHQAKQFQPFVPDREADDEEKEFREACSVVWPDDPYLPPPPNAKADDGTEYFVAAEAPPSYRYTPRGQRSNYYGDDMEQKERTIKAGRAKILFKKALNRYSLRQKGLIAAAAWAQMDYEEGGAGCHHLLLSRNGITSRGASHVCTLVKTSVILQTVALGCNPIGDTGAALLGRALQVTRVLRTLAIQDCQIEPKGIRHLASGLANNRTLEQLWLFGNRAADEGAAHLASALRFCKLEALGLERNGITPKGCEALGLAITYESCCLKWLRLQHNRLGDEGVTHIANALHDNRTLTKLQLRDTGVGSQGCMALASAIRVHPQLFSLGLEDNNLTSASTTPLVRAMDASPVLQHLLLDLVHGGSYSRLHTREELNKSLTLTLLGMKVKGKGSSSSGGVQALRDGPEHRYKFQKVEDVNAKVDLLF